jgi:hypothetical protein
MACSLPRNQAQATSDCYEVLNARHRALGRPALSPHLAARDVVQTARAKSSFSRDQLWMMTENKLATSVGGLFHFSDGTLRRRGGPPDRKYFKTTRPSRAGSGPSHATQVILRSVVSGPASVSIRWYDASQFGQLNCPVFVPCTIVCPRRSPPQSLFFAGQGNRRQLE